jgi:hypothetical protein
MLPAALGSPNEATPAHRGQLRVAAPAAFERHARPVYSRLERLILMKAGMKKGYTLAVMSSSYRTCLVTIALLVAAFVALYPLLDCGPGGCPEILQASHAAHAGLSTACLAAVLVGSLAAPAFASFSGRRRPVNQRRPAAAYLSPNTPPPRVLSSR